MLLVPQTNITRNILAPPSGVAPGFDPSHIAAGTITPLHGFSGVAANGGFYNLLSGKRQNTSSGTPSRSIYSGLGESTFFSGGGLTFSGNKASADANFTIAAIVVWTAGSSKVIFSTDDAGNGVYFRYNGVNSIDVTINSSTATPTPLRPLISNVPYFLAVSSNGSIANFMTVNLLSGQIATGTATPVANVTCNGIYTVGAVLTTVQPWAGNMAAAMFSNVYLPIQSLYQWGSNPWSFWYPELSTYDQIVGAAPVIASAIGSRLPLMGAGL